MLQFFFHALLLVGLVHAASLPSIQPRAKDISADMLLKIAPGSDTCPEPAEECATNKEAAPYINQAMAKYRITSPGERASILALIAHESGNFKYNINHFPAPGNPGQGTRNMQSAAYNLEYVKSIPKLASKTKATSTNDLSPAELNDIRNLVLPDQYSWASAAWFLTQQKACADARKLLQKEGDYDDGFIAHMQCVGVPDVGEDRLARWKAAKAALGI
ncbi:hypothetical protein K3495_g9845 [Podosphaera aphanis]|nr:hypothetical protein K3495_g9845 [Podosphaera aphanis]